MKPRHNLPDNALPLFRIPSSDRTPLRLVPPFPFDDMTTRVFPLRARLDVLQRFCDSYLNIIPPELGRFRPAAPYVYLLMVNYGKMAVQAENMGWFAQREIVFNVPVEWYKRVRGRMVFQDWALVSPFIFVDHELSLTMGRTVFGWPKTVARLDSGESGWMKDPTAPFRHASASTTVFPELYQKKRLEERTFLEIDADSRGLQWPPHAEDVVAPWTAVGNLAQAMGGLSSDWLGMLDAIGLVPPHWGSDPRNYLARMGRAGEMLYPLGRDRAANTLNLKQFRLSEQPDDYCFQALTNGPIRLTALRRMAFLGQHRLLLGDISGGYRVRLHHWPSLPIVETLGLVVKRSWDGAGCRVSELAPVAPFWLDAAMEYLQGYNVAWRSEDTTWRDRDGCRYPLRKAPAPADRRFNTTLGSFNKALVGPFTYTGSKIRVLPLLASREKLHGLVTRYVNDALKGTNQRYRLWTSIPLPKPPKPPKPEPPRDGDPQDPPDGSANDSRAGGAATPVDGTTNPGSQKQDCPPPNPDREVDIPTTPYAYVYMVVTAYGNVESSTNNVGDWASLEVSFLVPIVREERNETTGSWDVCGVGLLPVAVYVDDVAAVGAGAEVLGLPTIQSKFGRPAVTWLTDDPAEAAAPQQLLRVGAPVLPVFGEGQEARMRTVLEVTRGNFLDGLNKSSRPVQAADWARRLIAELERKDATARAHAFRPYDRARALALELLSSRQPFSYFTLKQVRDIEQPDRASYQSLVSVQRRFTEIHEVKEIVDDLVVTIHETPSHPLVSTLGLVGVNVAGRGAGLAYAMQPIRPFEMSVDMTETLGRCLLQRSRGTRWKPPTGVRGSARPGTYFRGSRMISIELKLPRPLALGDPACLETDRSNDAEGPPEGSDPPTDHRTIQFDMPTARDAIQHVDPQMVLEALLAREWGRSNPRWERDRKQLEELLKQASSGLSATEAAENELVILRRLIVDLKNRNGGARTKTLVDEAVVDRYDEVATKVAAIEKEWKAIVTGFGGLDENGQPRVGWEGLGVRSPSTVDQQFEAVSRLIALTKMLVKIGPPLGAPSGLIARGDAAALARLAELNRRLARQLRT